MDTNNLKGLMEAYSEVYAPQEVDEAVKGADPEMRKAASAERRGGDKRLSPSKGKGYADQQKQSISYMDKVTKKNKNVVGLVTKEEIDIFDVVLEFLQAEGFAETLEEAEWMMANVIDEEAIEIILGEEELDEASRRDEFTRAAIARNSGKKGGITFEPGPNWDASANRGKGAHISPKQKEKQRRKGLRAEEYMDEASSRDEFTRAAIARSSGRKGGITFEPGPNWDPSANRGKGAHLSSKQKEKQRRKALRQEEFEAWLDEAMTNYEKNRKRAAQRAAARNEARAQGKTGAVPGVGYVTPRKERETWTDESGKTRHAKGL